VEDNVFFVTSQIARNGDLSYPRLCCKYHFDWEASFLARRLDSICSNVCLKHSIRHLFTDLFAFDY
jgi:hypothetical protein